MNVTTIAAWVAVVVSVVALGRSTWELVVKRHKEKEAVQTALDNQPYIREQLALGNVGEAVKALNQIIDSQTKHIKVQDQRLAAQDKRIEHLEDREAALEAESEGWARRYREVLQELQDLRAVVTRRNL